MLNTVPSTLATKLARYCSSSARFRDRKSTRLNSSHLVISYAVFCLKKKKNSTHLAEYIVELANRSCPFCHSKRLVIVTYDIPVPCCLCLSSPYDARGYMQATTSSYG